MCTEKAPGPVLAEGKFLPRISNDCLGVAYQCKNNKKFIAFPRPLQLRVLLGSGVHPGWNPTGHSKCPPFPDDQTTGD